MVQTQKKAMRSVIHIFIPLLATLFLMGCGGEKSSSDPLSGEKSPGLNLMPWPAELTLGAGRFTFGEDPVLLIDGHSDDRLVRGVDRMLDRLKEMTGLALERVSDAGDQQASLVIDCRAPGEERPSLGEDETYRLSVAQTGVRLSAPTSVGVLRGLETLLQLIESAEGGFGLPVLEIEDRPRFPWRGLLIDSCRHWMPAEVIKRNLDGMAAVKLNVLHWHLSEDQGFRVECKVFPKLHEMGSDGDYYTQEEIREIIDYARDRGIRIVPEFDMPGHTTAWLAGYPELGSSPGPFEIIRTWGIHDPCLDPTREEVYTFLEQFLKEMCALFPDDYFHIGGDEVNGKHWDANPDIAAFKAAKGMKDNHDLQAYFNTRIQSLLEANGKKMVGWDEIYHPDLPRDIVIHSWRGLESLARTAADGFMGILSNGYYLDHILPAATHYAVDPLSGAGDLTDEARARILGGEACMWAEFVSPQTIDSRIWPRTAAVAERLWSPSEVKDLNDMYRRLDVIGRHLDLYGLKHNSEYPLMLRHLTGGGDTGTLETLAEIIEPVKYYTRPSTREYTQQTPLDRLVDAARPESRKAGRFMRMAAELAADAPEHRKNRETVEEWLTVWWNNHDKLLPAMEDSPSLGEVIPLSEEIASLSAATLRALESLENKEPMPDQWFKDVLPRFDRPEKPDYELVAPVLPSMRGLIEAARWPYLYGTDFDTDDGAWTPHSPENWSVEDRSGNAVYRLTGVGPEGQVRAPRSWSLIENHDLSSFVFSGLVLCEAEVENPHRDICLIFHFQDETHFAYVHLSASSDESHNIIGLVDGADRIKVNLEPAGRSRSLLSDRAFHPFWMVCDGEAGTVRVYLDSWDSPILTAENLSLDHGRVGVGSFDDTGCFDNIRLWGIRR